MEIYLHHLCRYLVDRSCEIRIATPGNGGLEYEAVPAGFPVFSYPLAPDPTTAEVQGIMPARGAAALHDWIAAERPDVVHFHHFGPGMGVSELEAARAAGARIVLTLHLPSLGLVCLRTTMMRWGTEPCDGRADAIECAACCFESKGLPRTLARQAARMAARAGARATVWPGPLGRMAAMPAAVTARMQRMREAFALCDRVVALADWARAVLIANGAPEEKVVLNRVGCALPAAPRMASPSRANRPIRIGFVGRFHAEKGARLLLRAFRSLPPAMPAELEMYGSVHGEDERGELVRLEKLRGGDARIRICTNVGRNEVAKAMADWDVACCPSLQFELGPMAALEAFSRGVPVIGSDLPNLNALIDDGVSGRLFRMGDEKALAGILGSIVASPRTTLEVWRRRIPPVRTMDEVAEDYLRLYEEMIR